MKQARFTFIDLFAGIGGMHLAFAAKGGKCVFTSEWNTFAQKTLRANYLYSEEHPLIGDITHFPIKKIPDHDILLAGFPCQPFSIAGVSKKNALGRPHGFACKTQGTLFFDVARILAEKKPRAFLLENVKNLLSHDNGNTFKIILETLQQELDYDIYYHILNGAHFVPQHRQRIYIIGFRNKTNFSWSDIFLPKIGPTLSSILHPEDGTESPEAPYTLGKKARVNEKYTLSPNLWAYLQAYAKKHRAAGNGFGFGLASADSIARTLSARYYKDGSEILIPQKKSAPTKIALPPRRLTPRECARLMGFPDTFQIPVSDTQAYRQFGNSVVVPLIQSIATAMIQKI